MLAQQELYKTKEFRAVMSLLAKEMELQNSKSITFSAVPFWGIFANSKEMVRYLRYLENNDILKIIKTYRDRPHKYPFFWEDPLYEINKKDAEQKYSLITSEDFGYSIDDTFSFDCNKEKIFKIIEIANNKSNNKGQAINNLVCYDFNQLGIPTGKLNIGTISIEFQKIPAEIINYFFTGRKFFGKKYKNYKDFNEHIRSDGEQVSSDDFSKKIKSINTRVCKETGSFIKELIEKKMDGNSRKQSANNYRFKTDL